MEDKSQSRWKCLEDLGGRLVPLIVSSSFSESLTRRVNETFAENGRPQVQFRETDADMVVLDHNGAAVGGEPCRKMEVDGLAVVSPSSNLDNLLFDARLLPEVAVGGKVVFYYLTRDEFVLVLTPEQRATFIADMEAQREAAATEAEALAKATPARNPEAN